MSAVVILLIIIALLILAPALLVKALGWLIWLAIVLAVVSLILWLVQNLARRG